MRDCERRRRGFRLWTRGFADNTEAGKMTSSVADLGEGPRGPGAPLLVEYLQTIYKKTTEMSIQKPF